MSAAPAPTAHDFAVWTTTGRLVVTDSAALPSARQIVRTGLREVELACSRFDADSEVCRLTGPGPHLVSPLLADLVGVALAAAEASDGLVDPTVGTAMQELGYDLSFDRLPTDGPSVGLVRAIPGWRQVRLDGDRLDLPAGVLLDLGATAKARAADLLAARVAHTLGVGVLLELGGDIATAGQCPQGWQVAVRDTADDPAGQVTLAAGAAVATSSTVRRTWHRGGTRLHHILDPRTAAPAAPVWRSVTIAAPTCVEANTAATAAVIVGTRAAQWLSDRGLSARLVDQRRRVVHVGDWPDEPHGPGEVAA